MGIFRANAGEGAGGVPGLQAKGSIRGYLGESAGYACECVRVCVVCACVRSDFGKLVAHAHVHICMHPHMQIYVAGSLS